MREKKKSQKLFKGEQYKFASIESRKVAPKKRVIIFKKLGSFFIKSNILHTEKKKRFLSLLQCIVSIFCLGLSSKETFNFSLNCSNKSLSGWNYWVAIAFTPQAFIQGKVFFNYQNKSDFTYWSNCLEWQ